LRRGVWFRALTRIERGIIDLTLRCVDKVQSNTLKTVLSDIIGKLENVVDHFFTWRLEQIGRPFAEGVSRAAALMGVKGAEKWKDDRSFLQLIGLHHLGG